MNLRIDQRIVPIVVASQMLLNPVTKEIVADVALGGAWVNRTPQQVSRTEVNRNTWGDIGHAVIVKHAPSPVLIRIVGISPPCGLNGSL